MRVSARVRTSVGVLDGDPAVGARVVRLDDVGRAAAAPAADHEHDLVRDARPSDRVGQVDVLAFFHVEVVEELDGLDDDRLALVVVVHQRVFLLASQPASRACRQSSQQTQYTESKKHWATFIFVKCWPILMNFGPILWGQAVPSVTRCHYRRRCCCCCCGHRRAGGVRRDTSDTW